MDDPTPRYLIFIGAIGLFAWWVWQRQQQQAMLPPTPATPDGDWTTSYFLRYNTPVPSGQMPILPQSPNDADPATAWALSNLYSGA